jgi:hypothetical protein
MAGTGAWICGDGEQIVSRRPINLKTLNFPVASQGPPRVLTETRRLSAKVVRSNFYHLVMKSVVRPVNRSLRVDGNRLMMRKRIRGVAVAAAGRDEF